MEQGNVFDIKGDPLDIVTYRKSARQHVREFGSLFSAIFALLAVINLYRHGFTVRVELFTLFALLFFPLGYFAPRLLHPLWKGWMAFAHVLGVIMTTLILTLVWVLLFIPVAVSLRLLGKQRMPMRFDRSRESYWEERDVAENDFKLLERQY